MNLPKGELRSSPFAVNRLTTPAFADWLGYHLWPGYGRVEPAPSRIDIGTTFLDRVWANQVQVFLHTRRRVGVIVDELISRENIEKFYYGGAILIGAIGLFTGFTSGSVLGFLIVLVLTAIYIFVFRIFCELLDRGLGAHEALQQSTRSLENMERYQRESVDLLRQIQRSLMLAAQPVQAAPVVESVTQTQSPTPSLQPAIPLAQSEAHAPQLKSRIGTWPGANQ